MREHLEGLRERTGKSPDGLEPPEFPEDLRYLWSWFLMLRMGLGEALYGQAPLTWVALDAWSRHTDNAPEPREVEALFALDAGFRNPEAE